MVTGTMDFNTVPGCGMAMYSDMALGCISSWDVFMAPGTSAVYPDLYALHVSMILRHHCRFIPQVSAQPLVVIGAMDIVADPDCSRATDIDMALGNSPRPDNTMSLGDK